MDKEFLLDYLNTDSPSTFEVEAQVKWVEQVKKSTEEVSTDNYGNAVAILKSKNKTDFNVVIDAHCDEIGWLVSGITKDGYIRVRKNGGTDNDITPTTRVRILTDSGKKINGVFGTTPIHLKNHDKPLDPKIETLSVDVLASSKEEVEALGIEVGNFVVFDRKPEIIDDKYIISKSLDDKVGGFIISEVLREIKERNIELPYNLYVVNSVQEEIGLRGADMISKVIKPNVAICYDVCFDTSTPMVDTEKFGEFKMGDGVIFRYGVDVHPHLLSLMKKVAKDNNYDYKISVAGGGGTNTKSYNLSNGGVISSTVSAPLRYMHTENETMLLSDIEKSINYIIDLLLNIEDNHNFKLLR
jgi:putative aminopeptidase FrvX